MKRKLSRRRANKRGNAGTLVRHIELEVCHEILAITDFASNCNSNARASNLQCKSLFLHVRSQLRLVARGDCRLPQTESLLTNATLDATIIERARRTISHEIAPITDVRSTEHYRRTVTGNALAKILRRL